ncbi:MAG: hypothetical protein HOO06_13215 [Bdellovibrionaceae bacterium]|nr:hypothetical protein [Pseudobdellovibrionaceae bacterium]
MYSPSTKEILLEIDSVINKINQTVLFSKSTSKNKELFTKTLSKVKTEFMVLDKNPLDGASLRRLHRTLNELNKVQFLSLDTSQLQNLFTVIVKEFLKYEKFQNIKLSKLSLYSYYGRPLLNNIINHNTQLTELVQKGVPADYKYDEGRRQLSFSSYRGRNRDPLIGKTIFVLDESIVNINPYSYVQVSQAINHYKDVENNQLVHILFAEYHKSIGYENLKWKKLEFQKVPKSEGWDPVTSEWLKLPADISSDQVIFALSYESQVNTFPSWNIIDFKVSDLEGVEP